MVMETLGHSQISLTLNTYSHVIPALGRAAAAQMDAMLGPQSADSPTELYPRGSVPVAPGGRFTKADFAIDLVTRTVTCPAPLRAAGREAVASFGPACAGCPLAIRCTSSAAGRTITVGPHEEQLRRGRAAQRDPAWLADYRATRPKVERKIGHLMRRRHGGRRARVRGRSRVGADFALLAAAVNLARLAVLRLVRTGGTWAIRAT